MSTTLNQPEAIDLNIVEQAISSLRQRFLDPKSSLHRFILARMTTQAKAECLTAFDLRDAEIFSAVDGCCVPTSSVMQRLFILLVQNVYDNDESVIIGRWQRNGGWMTIPPID